MVGTERKSFARRELRAGHGELQPDFHENEKQTQQCPAGKTQRKEDEALRSWRGALVKARRSTPTSPWLKRLKRLQSHRPPAPLHWAGRTQNITRIHKLTLESFALSPLQHQNVKSVGRGWREPLPKSAALGVGGTANGFPSSARVAKENGLSPKLDLFALPYSTRTKKTASRNILSMLAIRASID